MNSEEVDKIIEEALAESKGHGKHRKGKSLNLYKIKTIRKVLNTVFIIGFIVTVVAYFAFPENKALFFGLGFGSLMVKVIEFFIRFMM